MVVISELAKTVCERTVGYLDPLWHRLRVEKGVACFCCLEIQAALDAAGAAAKKRAEQAEAAMRDIGKVHADWRRNAPA